MRDLSRNPTPIQNHQVKGLGGGGLTEARAAKPFALTCVGRGGVFTAWGMAGGDARGVGGGERGVKKGNSSAGGSMLQFELSGTPTLCICPIHLPDPHACALCALACLAKDVLCASLRLYMPAWCGDFASCLKGLHRRDEDNQCAVHARAVRCYTHLCTMCSCVRRPPFF